MSNLIPFDNVVRLVNENEVFWADLGAHTPKHSELGRRLAAFFRDRWNPWYTRFMQVTARASSLDDKQQAEFAARVADGLVELRDVAGYRYQISSFYAPPRDVDAELAQIATDGHEMAQMLALNAGERDPDVGPPDDWHRTADGVSRHSRRSPAATRHR